MTPHYFLKTANREYIQFMTIKHILVVYFTITTLSLLQGCVAVATVAVFSGASMTTDHRTIKAQIEDQRIEFSVNSKLAKNQSLKQQTNLHFVSINGALLVVGQAPTSYLRDIAIKEVSDIKGVVKVHNQIRIGNTTSLLTRGNDVWLTSKVKTALLGSDKLSPTNIKVVTENSEVFLMGLVSHKEADEAVELTRNIGGVNRVFLAFEYKTNPPKK